jgi:hypothetical protein
VPTGGRAPFRDRPATARRDRPAAPSTDRRRGAPSAPVRRGASRGQRSGLRRRASFGLLPSLLALPLPSPVFGSAAYSHAARVCRWTCSNSSPRVP